MSPLNEVLNFKVIILVRKFGLVGGMEEYVYQLAIELCKKGFEIIIICEQSLTDPPSTKIQVVELGLSITKPRWFAHLRFAAKASKWITGNSHINAIIHSHERVHCHHLTTFHSSTYNFRCKKKFPNVRDFFNNFIEARELNYPKVSRIVPVSRLISSQISEKYPQTLQKLTSPISPATHPISLSKKTLSMESPVIGFMGKEWKRKGFLKVIRIWRKIRETIPDARLCLAGFSLPKGIHFTPIELKFVEQLGYVSRKEAFYSKIDILLHPASFEAYGMVIAEAISLGIPAICSNQCGAAEIKNSLLLKMDCDEKTSVWAETTCNHLRTSTSLTNYNRMKTWSDVADEYIKLYKTIAKEGIK